MYPIGCGGLESNNYFPTRRRERAEFRALEKGGRGGSPVSVLCPTGLPIP